MPVSITEIKNRLPKEFMENLYEMFTPGMVDNILKGIIEKRYTTLRVNTLKYNAQELMRYFKEQNIKFERVLWYPDAFVIKNANEKDIQKLDIYQKGYIYIQSLPSMVPPLVLAPKENENICFKGEDIKKGTLLVEKNKKLNFADIGIIASTGISKINVFKKPKIALISTGDEVIDVGNILTEGKIYNSNKYSIISRIFELGYSICEIQHAGDAEGEIGSYIEKLSKKFDLIITTGGVSVGEKDLLNEAMDKINGKRLFWKVKIKPGSAVLCSIVNNSIIISLSGNPTAALTAFELFVKTSLEKLSGKEKIEIKREKAILCDSFNKKSPQKRFIRGRVEIREEKQNVYITQVKSGNGILSSNLNSNCMIEVEAGNKGLQSGCIVNIIKF